MSKAPRRKLWARIATAHRDRLFVKDRRCFWCGRDTMKPGNPQYTAGRLATLDHVKSWPECGNIAEWSDRANLVIACRACNERRSHEWCLKTQSPKKWAIYLEKQVKAQREPLPPFGEAPAPLLDLLSL